jgi:hypothetical protein
MNATRIESLSKAEEITQQIIVELPDELANRDKERFSKTIRELMAQVTSYVGTIYNLNMSLGENLAALIEFKDGGEYRFCTKGIFRHIADSRDQVKFARNSLEHSIEDEQLADYQASISRYVR